MKSSKLSTFTFLLFFAFTIVLQAQKTDNTLHWPQFDHISKPFVRWWWHGSAVDKEGLTYRLEDLQRAGFGGVEITPIFGAKGFEDKYIDFLSPQWMNMLQHAIEEGERLDIGVEMNNGTGWPFGGPLVSAELAASKLIVQTYNPIGAVFKEKLIVNDAKQLSVAKLQSVVACSEDGKKINITHLLNSENILEWNVPEGKWTVYAVFNSKTLQKVKRAAPGGAGFVLDHLNKSSVDSYLSMFSQSFSRNNCTYPKTFFCDSYEVYGADWTSNMFNDFYSKRHYRLEKYIPELSGIGSIDTIQRVQTDYRQTISELMLDSFAKNWTKWAHANSTQTRFQAHGSPGNLIDLYASVDIPECESYGATFFDIPGIRYDDSIYLKLSDSEPIIQKMASSAAHITGKKYTSSETFTWLTEHFRTSLSQCKPELDQLFLSGINHVYFHGVPYSPKNAPWPGWLFYASINFSSYNTIWNDISPFTSYITNCQSMLQSAKPDNDFLLYFPINDIWNKQTKNKYFTFAIHDWGKWLENTAFYESASTIRNAGYDFDMISDLLLDDCKVDNGLIKTKGASYKALIISSCQTIPLESLEKIKKIIKEGGKVVFIQQFPKDIPGLYELKSRKQQFEKSILEFPVFHSGVANFGKGSLMMASDNNDFVNKKWFPNEKFQKHGLRYVRMKHDDGSLYFITNMQNKSVDQWIPFSQKVGSAALLDPLNNQTGWATLKNDSVSSVHIVLKSGQSVFAKTFSTKQIVDTDKNWKYFNEKSSYPIKGEWLLSVSTNNAVSISKKYVDSLYSWAEDERLQSFSGMGEYSVEFTMPETDADEWMLDLGDVRESARVFVNGDSVTTLWCVPFQVNIGKYLKKGTNKLLIKVTNLPANRIAEMDRMKEEWKIFNEINFVNVFYKPFDASSWKPLQSGLLGPVKLTALTKF